MATMQTNQPRTETRPEWEVRETRVPGRYIGWPSITSGILSVVAGAVGIIAGIAALVGVTFLSATFGAISGAPLFAGGGVALALGIVAVIGGAYALRRRVWGMALAGAIISTILMPLLGIPSLIFLAIGKRDF